MRPKDQLRVFTTMILGERLKKGDQFLKQAKRASEKFNHLLAVVAAEQSRPRSNETGRHGRMAEQESGELESQLGKRRRLQQHHGEFLGLPGDLPGGGGGCGDCGGGDSDGGDGGNGGDGGDGGDGGGECGGEGVGEGGGDGGGDGGEGGEWGERGEGGQGVEAGEGAEGGQVAEVCSSDGSDEDPFGAATDTLTLHRQRRHVVCRACTFLNQPGSDSCSMCNSAAQESLRWCGDGGGGHAWLELPQSDTMFFDTLFAQYPYGILPQKKMLNASGGHSDAQLTNETTNLALDVLLSAEQHEDMSSEDDPQVEHLRIFWEHAKMQSPERMQKAFEDLSRFPLIDCPQLGEWNTPQAKFAGLVMQLGNS